MNHQLQRRINQMLGAAGLGQLDSPGLVGQIAYMVRDHEHFGSLLMACEPEERQHMWDALAPNLRFKPYALDHYLLKARADAEARRLPVQQPDGTLKQYEVPEITSAVDPSAGETAAE